METPPTEDHADVRILPPLLFLGSIALGVLLQLAHRRRASRSRSGWRVPLGLALVALGVGGDRLGDRRPCAARTRIPIRASPRRS